MKSWELEGALDHIFLLQTRVKNLVCKLEEMAKEFKVDVTIKHWIASGEKHLLCLPKLTFFGEEHLSQLVGLRS